MNFQEFEIKIKVDSQSVTVLVRPWPTNQGNNNPLIFNITIDAEIIGLIYKEGETWRMNGDATQDLVDAIGEVLDGKYNL
ncbi:hypothetical protein [Foetidibacter luteolus]|uniref:hypothetical protein n=1 Tax=Foetidibacter luteolus TaxID=2608880 RepID=UPI00129BA751|nr:hypothetical protein [Foetidibacter luteolus]